MAERLCEAQKSDDLLLEVVDETIFRVFKAIGVKVIYNFLEKNAHLKREDIGHKPDSFSAALERLLGSGASVIENLILKNLYSRLGMSFEEREGYKFSDYLKDLKKKLEE